MLEIEELDKESLVKSKKRKIGKYIKKTVLGILAGSIMLSTIPNIEYGYALHEAKSDSSISEIMDSSDSKIEKVEKIFKEGITKNNNLDDELKEQIIEAFTEKVIKPHGDLFSDETIYNMYAVASTEDVRFMTQFERDHGWWSGDYNSYLNKMILLGTDADLLAHEQLHAILKKGLFETGFTAGLSGYGVNEGFTASLLNSSYYTLRWYVNNLSYILGYENIFKYFVNSDLEGFKQELSRYIDKDDINTFIKNMNSKCLYDYYMDFASKNGLEYNSDKIYEKKGKWLDENIDILKKIYTKKYGDIPENSNRGRLLLKSLCAYDEDVDYYATIDANNSDIIKVSVQNFGFEGLGRIEIMSSEYNLLAKDKREKFMKEVSKQLGVDENLFTIGYAAYNGDKYVVAIESMACKIDKDEIDNFDIDKYIESVKKFMESFEKKEPEKAK